MNDLSIQGDRRMTVREVAEALGLDPRTIQLKIKELFPEIVHERETTYLTEAQVTAVKMACEKRFAGVATDLERRMVVAQAMQFLQEDLDAARAELSAAQPKIACAEALMRSDRSMSITDAAKHFGLHPKTEVFPYLRSRGYLTREDLPTQAAIDAGYLSLKETKDQAGNVWPQAVVEAWQLEVWRAHVVHQIKHFVGERATV